MSIQRESCFRFGYNTPRGRRPTRRSFTPACKGGTGLLRGCSKPPGLEKRESNPRTPYEPHQHNALNQNVHFCESHLELKVSYLDNTLGYYDFAGTEPCIS